uniref:Uncharacterized protein n=1 Tax=Lygus hesperus TaxID=30085 RepID=A0A0A9WRW9_LYGHE
MQQQQHYYQQESKQQRPFEYLAQQQQQPYYGGRRDRGGQYEYHDYHGIRNRGRDRSGRSEHYRDYYDRFDYRDLSTGSETGFRKVGNSSRRGAITANDGPKKNSSSFANIKHSGGSSGSRKK